MRAILKSPLSIALMVVLFCVLTQSTQLFDHVYWNVWNKNHARPAPKSAIVVSLDSGLPISARSIASSTAEQARLIEKLEALGADHIFLDFPTVVGVDTKGDKALYTAIAKAGQHLTMVNRAKVVPAENNSRLTRPSFTAPPGTQVAVSVWKVNFLGYALNSVSAVEQGGKPIPVVAIVGAHNVSMDRRIYPDFRIDPGTIPVIDAKAVLNGNIPAATLAHRRVYVTGTNLNLDSTLGYFGHKYVPAAVLDIAGANGLGKGHMLVLGGEPLLFLFIGAALLVHRLRRRWAILFVYAFGSAAILILPGVLRGHGIVMSPDLALIAALVYGPVRSSQKWRRRVQLTNAASGLPNIEAMAAEGIPRTHDVVAASISQYEQMLASLPRELHGECARQIARRLSLGAGDCQIYDNDNGHFVWLEESRTLDALVEHLEGLKALFSSPLVIDGHVLDTHIHFGLDRNIDSKPITRIQSALASAIEAQNKSKLYEEFGEQRLAESPWELSLHARIDEGLRNGDIWLALQPQYDFRTSRISGAEALIRWDDPERGMIPPDTFILQAERVGRIEAITYWVLGKAIGMLKVLNEVSPPFQISVNLSARMVDHPMLIGRIDEIVRQHELEDCSQITFEVTETFSMTNREQARRNLADLREMGFRLSIDDFGTGQASLTYLAEIPSDEIKLDRRFVQSVAVGPEKHIADSVIKLAHALNQEVVAEGVEDKATLEMLRQLGCDLAQGYYIGRPVKLPDLLKLLGVSPSEAAKNAAGYG